MKYLLDTCIVEALLKAEPGHENIRDRIAAAPQGSLAISALTAVEIWTGTLRYSDARSLTPFPLALPKIARGKAGGIDQ